MLTFISLPSNLIAYTLSYFQEVFGDLAPVVAMIIGLPLAFWAVYELIQLFAIFREFYETYKRYKD